MNDESSPITIHSIYSGKASLNACAQALSIEASTLSRPKFFRLLGVPQTFTSTNRYWRKSYNILPWSRRPENEQDAALLVAQAVLRADCLRAE